MEAQAEDSGSFRSASANSPLPSRISLPATRARPKLLPHALVSAEKVLLHHVKVPVQIMLDMSLFDCHDINHHSGHSCPFQVKTASYLPPELPELGQIQIRVTAVGDDGLIYMRSQNTGSVFFTSASKAETRFTSKSFLMLLVSLSERRFEQLMETVGEHMKTLPRPKCYEWKSVQGCAVMGSDMLWYRGEVVEVLGEFVKVSVTTI